MMRKSCSFCPKRILHLSLAVLILMLSACGGRSEEPTSDPGSRGRSDEASSIVVGQPDAATQVVGSEEIPLPNCGGSGPLRQTLGDSTTVRKGFQLGARATTGAGVEVSIPQTAKVQLQAEIEATYQRDFERADSRLDTIQMEAAPDSHVVYEIEWVETVYASDVSFIMHGESHQAPYNYSLTVPRLRNDPGNPVRESCPGSYTEEDYQSDLAEWENFSPTSLSIQPQDRTLRALDAIDFETGSISSAPSEQDRQWDLEFVCGSEGTEALRAFGGTQWFEHGLAQFDSIKYRDIRDANFTARTHPETGYSDLYYVHKSNAPQDGYVYFFRTSDGNVVKFQIRSYELVDDNPLVCRNMNIRYEAFPDMEGPERPEPPN